jgi:putative acetyltransferase
MKIQNVLIREERSTDLPAISEVTVAAFETMEISDHTEQYIIEALRAVNALAVSLVAVADGHIVGHIAFSPVTMSDGSTDWYGAGPVSVHPDFQRGGIGKALIREGLSRLKALKAKGCCLVGHPDYYGKLGFENVDGLEYKGVPPEAFFVMPFDGDIPQGVVVFHEAFKATGKESDSADG